MDINKTKAVKECKLALKSLKKSVGVAQPRMDHELKMDLGDCFVECFEHLEKCLIDVSKYLDDCIMEGVIPHGKWRSFLTYERASLAFLGHNLVTFQSIFMSLDLKPDIIDYVENFLYTQDIIMSGFFNFLKDEIYPEMKTVDNLFVTGDKVNYSQMMALYNVELFKN